MKRLRGDLHNLSSSDEAIARLPQSLSYCFNWLYMSHGTWARQQSMVRPLDVLQSLLAQEWENHLRAARNMHRYAFVDGLRSFFPRFAGNAQTR